jgi:trk system potassium uptake protein TrkA
MRDFCIIGLGHFGRILATELIAMGHTVVGVDRNSKIVEKLKDKIRDLYVLDATNPDALKEIGITDFDCAIVAIGDSVQANILTTQNLIDLGIESIWARAESDIHERILRKLGVQQVFITERDTAMRMASILHNPDIIDMIDLLEGYSVALVKVGPTYSGKTLKEIDFRSKFNVLVIAIQRRNKTTPLAGPNDKIYEGDYLFLAGKSEVLSKIKEV